MTREEKAQYCMDNPKKTPAFQFYPDCWWGSRHVAGMTPEERGIHASLIFSAWLEENCGIPENEICLSARVPDDKKILVEKVLSWCWFLHQCFWFCERLLNERIKQINVSNERHVAGCKGGRPVKSKIYNKKAIDNQKVKNEKAKITKSEDEDEDEDININTKEGMQGGKEKSLPERDEEFKTTIDSMKEFTQDLKESFYDYWSQPNKAGKMRWELEKTWDLKKRLNTWKRNNETNFGKNPAPLSEEDERRAIEERQRLKRERGEL